GFRVAEAVLVAVGVLTALSAYNTVSARMGMRTVVGSQLRDLSRGGADMARHIAEIERGLSTLERRVEATLSRARAAADPLSNEIGELSLLVKQLAETVASHEARLAELQRSRPAVAGTPAVAAPAPAAPVTAPPAVPVAPAPVALAPAVPAPAITTAEAPPPA